MTAHRVAFTPCGASTVWRGVFVVCTLRTSHDGPCCWWAACASDADAHSDRGAGAPKDAD